MNFVLNFLLAPLTFFLHFSNLEWVPWVMQEPGNCSGEGTWKRLQNLAFLGTYETDKKRKHREARKAKLQSLPTLLNLLDGQVCSNCQRFTSRLARDVDMLLSLNRRGTQTVKELSSWDGRWTSCFNKISCNLSCQKYDILCHYGDFLGETSYG